MNLKAVINHPATRIASKAFLTIMAVSLSLLGILVGSTLGFIAICGLVATIFKGADADIMTGALWFCGCLCGSMFVTFGLQVIAKIIVRILDPDGLFFTQSSNQVARPF
jgi:hypothetical protein